MPKQRQTKKSKKLKKETIAMVTTPGTDPNDESEVPPTEPEEEEQPAAEGQAVPVASVDPHELVNTNVRIDRRFMDDTTVLVPTSDPNYHHLKKA
jgi:hypothetical protein